MVTISITAEALPTGARPYPARRDKGGNYRVVIDRKALDLMGHSNSLGDLPGIVGTMLFPTKDLSLLKLVNEVALTGVSRCLRARGLRVQVAQRVAK
jgi:hypothetical protein